MDAAGRGNYSRDEGTATVTCEVTVAVFGHLFPSLKVERTVRVLMAEETIAFRGGSIPLKFVDDGDVNDEIAHFRVAHICSKKLKVTDNGLVARGGDARNVLGASGEARVPKEGL